MNTTTTKLADKNAFVSHMNEEGLDFMIIKLEEEIANVSATIGGKMPDYNAAKEMWEEKQSEMNKLTQDLEKKKNWLSGLVANRGNNLGNFDIRVLRATSHTEDRHRNEVKRRLSWIKPAQEILERDRKFYTPTELFKLVLDEYPDHAKFAKEAGLGTSKFRVVKNWITSAENTDKKIGTPVLALYKHKGESYIGLYVWMKGEVPLPSLMTQFMFASGKIEEEEDGQLLSTLHQEGVHHLAATPAVKHLPTKSAHRAPAKKTAGAKKH